jgi:hypothetical protein
VSGPRVGSGRTSLHPLPPPDAGRDEATSADALLVERSEVCLELRGLSWCEGLVDRISDRRDERLPEGRGIPPRRIASVVGSTSTRSSRCSLSNLANSAWEKVLFVKVDHRLTPGSLQRGVERVELGEQLGDRFDAQMAHMAGRVHEAIDRLEGANSAAASFDEERKALGSERDRSLRVRAAAGGRGPDECFHVATAPPRAIALARHWSGRRPRAPNDRNATKGFASSAAGRAIPFWGVAIVASGSPDAASRFRNRTSSWGLSRCPVADQERSCH